MNIVLEAAISLRMNGLREQQLAWLDHIVETSGLSLTQIARVAHLDPSSLTRFRNRNDSGHALTAKTVKKIEDATRVPAYESKIKPVIQSFGEEEAQPFLTIENPDNPVEAALGLATKQAKQIHLWTLKTNSLGAIGYHQGMVVAVDTDTAPRNGDAVCAQKYDFRRGTAETIFRVFRAPYLLTAYITGEPGTPEVVDNENVVLMGTVVGGFRLRQ